MALDSRQKRAAVVGVGRAWYRNASPSSIDAPQRASIAQVYPVALFQDVAVPETVTGGVKRKRRTQKVDRNFLPWTQQADPIEEEFIEKIERPKLKIVKRAPQPDFDSTLEGERLDRELVAELKRVNKLRKKQAQRRRAIEMLLLS